VDASVRLYFDHAATSPLHPEVGKALGEAFALFGNPSSLHSFGRQAKSSIEFARSRLASDFGLSPSEVFFHSGATEGIYSVLHHAILRKGIHTVWTSRLEHHAVLDSLEAFARQGAVRLRFFENDPLGRVDWKRETAPDASGPGVLWMLMLYNNEIGNRNPIERIAEHCALSGTTLICDAVQAVGLDLPRLSEHPGLDAMVFSAHKFRGPKGIGFALIRKKWHYKSLFQGGAQERGLRAGTENTPGIVGLHKAWELAMCGAETRKGHLIQLRELWVKAARDRGWSLNGAHEAPETHPGILNLHVPYAGRTAVLLFKLDLVGLAVSEGSACSSGSSQGSHVIDALGIRQPGWADLRISMGSDNTAEEVHEAIDRLCTVLNAG